MKQKRLGIFTIGGGVPRNWSQQFGPFVELRHRRLGVNIPLKRYHYGLRICPEPVYWGGLSGSPYSEALHVTERYRRIDRGHMSVEITIDDPKAYTKPWTTSFKVPFQPGWDLLEYVCLENNKDLEHLGTKGPR